MGIGSQEHRGSWWWDERGEDVAEYAVMLAVITALAMATVRLVGSSTNTVFSSIASAIQ